MYVNRIMHNYSIMHIQFNSISRFKLASWSTCKLSSGTATARAIWIGRFAGGCLIKTTKLEATEKKTDQEVRAWGGLGR